MIISFPRRLPSIAFALFGFCLWAGAIIPAEAATRLIIDTVDHGISGKAQIVISDGRVRLTHSGMPRQEVLFISGNREVYFIRHARKELTRVDPTVLRQSIDQFSGIAQSLMAQRETLSEEKRQQLDEMLKSLGIPDPEAIAGGSIKLKHLGQQGDAAGIRCQWWQIRREERAIGRSCVTDNEGLGIPPADFQTLAALAAYVQELQLSASALLSSMGFVLPPLGLADSSSLPIRLEKVSGAFSATLAAVDRLDVSLRLMVPQGYRIIGLPGG
ncbi:MAG TPA: hypothetical protein DCE12_07775 [Gammaproteobacteria bacterium]|nr:hypothetical protein [Gammaproteobacteria bacterium]HAF74504.1 hypothetical protein [Gammaproteobacteria bacterium]